MLGQAADLRDRRTLLRFFIVVLAAFFVYWVETSAPRSVPLRIEEAVAGVAAVALAARNPLAALCTVIVYVPLQQTLLAALWSAGMPGAVARGAGFVKEAVVAGIVIAALANRDRTHRRLGSGEVAGLLLIGLAVLYFVAPVLSPGIFGGQPTSVRLFSLRLNLLFLILFLAVRRLQIEPVDLRRVENCVFFVGVVIAAGGLWELFDRHGYDHALTTTIRQPLFVQDVLHGAVQQGSVLILGNLGSHTFTRNGSFIIDATTLGFFLVTPLLIGVRRLMAGVTHRALWTLVGTVAIAVVLVDTLTRSAVLGAIVGTLLLLSSGLRRRQTGALVLAIALVGSTLLYLPFAGSSTFAKRVSGAVDNQDTSAQQHKSKTTAALKDSLSHPIGYGLGADPATGAQRGSTNAVTAEDNYLQISLELGWVGLLLFVLVLFGTGRDLAATQTRGPPLGNAALPALVGLSIGALFLHVWIDFQTSLTFWGYAGACCAAGATAQEATSEPELVSGERVVETSFAG